jgi:hypothetical protein
MFQIVRQQIEPRIITALGMPLNLPHQPIVELIYGL